MLLGERLKKALALFMLISFVPCIAFSQESDGRFSRVLEGKQSPFDAWCFDDIAMAKIKASLEFAEERCNLHLSNVLEQEKARHSLEVGNLQIRIDSLETEMRNTLAIKNEEIKLLEAAALKRPNDYAVWWATGGVVVGVLTTLAIVVAVDR